MELHNVDILRAMRLEEDSSGLEVVFTVRVTSQSKDMIAAEAALSTPFSSYLFYFK